jgi:hypothetical protein
MMEKSTVESHIDTCTHDVFYAKTDFKVLERI